MEEAEVSDNVIEVDFIDKKRITPRRSLMGKLAEAFKGFISDESNVVRPQELHSRLHQNVLEENRRERAEAIGQSGELPEPIPFRKK